MSRPPLPPLPPLLAALALLVPSLAAAEHHTWVEPAAGADTAIAREVAMRASAEVKVRAALDPCWRRAAKAQAIVVVTKGAVTRVALGATDDPDAGPCIVAALGTLELPTKWSGTAAVTLTATQASDVPVARGDLIALGTRGGGSGGSGSSRTVDDAEPTALANALGDPARADALAYADQPAASTGRSTGAELRASGSTRTASAASRGDLAIAPRDPAADPQPLAAGDIERTIRSRLSAIRACYRKALAQDPDLTGEIWMHLVVRPDGRVTESKVASSTLHASAVEACVSSKLKRARFPTARGASTIDYALTFASP